jgi:anti-sigma factor RsiW
MSDRDMHRDFDAPGRIQEYLDGVLSPEDERAFEAYMSTSPILRKQVASWRALMGQLDGLPRLVPSPQFRERRPLAASPRACPGETPGRVPGRGRGLVLTLWTDGVRPSPFGATAGLRRRGSAPGHGRPHPGPPRGVRPVPDRGGGMEDALRLPGNAPGLQPGPSFADRVMGALPSGRVEGAVLAPSAAPSPSGAGFPERLAARIRLLVPGTGRIRALAGAVAGGSCRPGGPGCSGSWRPTRSSHRGTSSLSASGGRGMPWGPPRRGWDRWWWRAGPPCG